MIFLIILLCKINTYIIGKPSERSCLVVVTNQTVNKDTYP